MAFDINWGMAQSPNYINNALAAFQQGMGMGREMSRDKAVAAYAHNPDDPKAVAGIARFEPQIAMQYRQDQKKQEAQAQRAALVQRATSGDPGALTELAGVDTDLWMKLDDRTKDQVKRSTSFMGQAAMDVSRLPEEQRAAAWARYVQQAESNGMDIPAQYETYSPQALNGVVAEVGAMDKLIKQFEPDYRVVPQGGYLENVNPLSRGGAVPSGAPQGAPPPPPGFVIDGQGGPTQPASATFQP